MKGAVFNCAGPLKLFSPFLHVRLGFKGLGSPEIPQSILGVMSRGI